MTNLFGAPVLPVILTSKEEKHKADHLHSSQFISASVSNISDWPFENLSFPAFGDVFSVIGVREPQAAASEAFVKFADAHRNIEKYGIQLLKTIKPVSMDSDLASKHSSTLTASLRERFLFLQTCGGLAEYILHL